MPRGLTAAGFGEAVEGLIRRDTALGAVVTRYGLPQPRRRRQGFATLAFLILEQQVSVASARAIYARMESQAGAVEPERILALGEDGLRAAGLSRQKALYVIDLAASVRDGVVDFRRIARADDDAVRDELTRVKGIGLWTADVYLLSALRRPDVMPARDLALQVAAQEIKGLESRPGEDLLTAIAEDWRPWRTVAAHLLWHYYRNTKRRQAPA